MFHLASSTLFIDLRNFLSLYKRSLGSVSSRYLRLSRGISTCTGSDGWQNFWSWGFLPEMLNYQECWVKVTVL